LFAPDHECPDDLVRAYQRHDEARTIAGRHRDLPLRAWRLIADIGHLFGLSVQGRLADGIGSAQVLILDRCNHFLAQAIGGSQPEELLQLVKDVDSTSLRARKLNCLGDDRGQHGLEIEGGVDRLADFAKRLQLFDRLREFARACLHLVEQPHVLDCDHRLVGEGRDQVDLLLRERINEVTREQEDTYRCAIT
jgi:hypothetical protein